MKTREWDQRLAIAAQLLAAEFEGEALGGALGAYALFESSVTYDGGRLEYVERAVANSLKVADMLIAAADPDTTGRKKP